MNDLTLIELLCTTTLTLDEARKATYPDDDDFEDVSPTASTRRPAPTERREPRTAFASASVKKT